MEVWKDIHLLLYRNVCYHYLYHPSPLGMFNGNLYGTKKFAQIDATFCRVSITYFSTRL